MKQMLQNEDVQIFISAQEGSNVPFVTVNTEGKEAKELFDALNSVCDRNFVLVCAPVNNWNDDLSPWPCEPVFKGSKPFAGNADLHLSKLLNDILPSAEIELDKKEINASYYAIAGYSLAGLFALYTLYQTDRFTKAVSASGSLWYPGLLTYTKEHTISCNVKQIYFSLGDQESHTKNKLMAAVGEMTQTLSDELGKEFDVFYEMNEGNHFKDPEGRLAKGIAYILNT
ncbi:MAG: hypothetical protein K5648_06430 [Erysipelotrichaceae bacterium]|nr:hypothetical protein [Erysipelotrichaceae bacterium]